MNNLWDVRPPPKIGDTNPDVLFAAVGRALSEWEFVESGLGDLFAILVGAPWGAYPISEPAVRAYGSIPGFQSRASMLEEAAEGYFSRYRNDAERITNEGMKERVHRTISVECKNFSSRRNEIAHGRIMLFPKGQNFLIPSMYASKKTPVGQMMKYCYNSADIIYYSQQFTELAERVSELGRDIEAVRRVSLSKLPGS